MKSYNHIFEKIVDKENIRKAMHKASLGKKDRPDVKKVLENEEHHIERVQRMLIDKTFFVPPHRLVEINDGIKQKKRIIVKPVYRYEQIIHHAIVAPLIPIFMRGMYEYSCGSVPKRGSHYGKKYIERFIKNNPKECKYCLKLDIHHFFQSISHNIIKERFAKVIHDKDTLWLIYKIIDGYCDHCDKFGNEYGLPIGFYTSQWFTNWYLEPLDHYIKQDLKAKCYVRYVDDIVIFGGNKKRLAETRLLISNFLKDNLQLELKDNWQVFLFDNGKGNGRHLDFMGFKFYRHKTTIRKSIMLRATRKARKLGSKPKVNWHDAMQMMSYIAWTKHTNSYNLYQSKIKPYVVARKLRQKISIYQHKQNRRKLENEYFMEKS